MQGHTNFGLVTMVLFSELLAWNNVLNAKNVIKFHNHVVLDLAEVLASLQYLTQLLNDF